MDEEGVWDACVEVVLEDPDIDEPDVDEPDVDEPDVDEPEVEEPDVDDPDTDIDDVSEVSEDVADDRLFEECSSDAEAGKEEVLSEWELVVMPVADEEVTWEVALLDCELSLAVEASVSLDVCVSLDIGFLDGNDVPLEAATPLDDGVSADCSVSLDVGIVFAIFDSRAPLDAD